MTSRNPLQGRQTAPVLSFLAVLALGLTGCDSPVCVFADGCVNGNSGGGEGSGDNSSLGSVSGVFPGVAAQMRGGAPEFLAAAPSGSGAEMAHPETPIFLEFSESLNPATLFDASENQSAFRVVDFTFQQDFPMQPPQLVGDGRVVVLLPLTPYREGSAYQVFFSENQQIADLSGQVLADPSAELLLEIFVDSSSVENEPRLIYSYPPDGSINQPDTSEIIFGFDREMDDSTIDSDSVRVTVGGATPTFNPDPEPLTTTLGTVQVPVTQVYRWTPQENGELVPYGTDADVVVRLSETPDEILSEAGDTLVPFETAFRTVDFTLPSAVVKASGSLPANAFGRADFIGGAPIIDVTLGAAAPGGTTADFFLFGRSRVDSTFVKALFRSVNVPSGATTFSVSGPDLDLVDASGDIEFGDGVA
ncbi:MAG: Ig-like domain-containing protein, partial [Planctomycetota bacterium]